MVERPEPAFRAHASSPHLPGDAGRVLNYLEMHLARRPDDLKGHTSFSPVTSPAACGPSSPSSHRPAVPC